METHFDFVVIGAGASGEAAAHYARSRLNEVIVQELASGPTLAADDE